MKIAIKENNVCEFESLIGVRVTLFCCRYIYTGELVGVSEHSLLLHDCGIVYETGAFDKIDWEDYQELPRDFYVLKSSIESFGILK